MTRGWLGATLAITRITFVRLRRGRALWIGVGIAALPVLFALVMAKSRELGQGAAATFSLVQLVLCVLPAMFVASTIGDDIEDRTITYLWSRAVPRESILFGKLLALAPVVVGLVLAAWAASTLIIARAAPDPRALLGLGLGALAACALAAGIGALVPKHGMALTICYLLFIDTLLGAMPVSLANIAITHHARTVAETGSLAAALGLIGISALWLAIGTWRIRRLEA